MHNFIDGLKIGIKFFNQNCYTNYRLLLFIGTIIVILDNLVTFYLNWKTEITVIGMVIYAIGLGTMLETVLIGEK